MILNKHGWGLRDMLIYSGIIIVFFLIAIYFIISMYHEMDLEVIDKCYEGMEEQLEENALIYLNDYYHKELDSEGLIISRNILRAYDLDVSLVDNNNHACSGYVFAKKVDNTTSVNAYIKCNDYMTNGYEE